MIARASRAGWVFLSAAAVAGVVLAHAIAYAVVLPGPHQRSEHLQATGHGYWPAAVYVAVALGAAAVTWAVARGVVAGRAGPADGARIGGVGIDGVGIGGARSGGVRFDGVGIGGVRFGSLAARQLLVFGVVELSERVVAGASVIALWREPAFVVGLAVQVVVAAGLALLLRHAETFAARVAAALRPPSAAARPRARWWAPYCESPLRQLMLGPARSRAPPAVVAAR